MEDEEYFFDDVQEPDIVEDEIHISNDEPHHKRAKVEDDTYAALFAADQAANPHWQRPALKPIDPSADSIAFQQIDCDMMLGEVLPGMPGNTVGPVPILGMYGINETGNSVMCYVHGFLHYFFVPAPLNFVETDCERFRKLLNAKVLEHDKGRHTSSDYILSVQMVMKEPIMGFHGNRKGPFLQITVSLPKFLSTAKLVLETGQLDIPPYGARGYQPYESNLDYVLRFMIDTGVLGCNWVELPAGSYRIRPKEKRLTHCQLEVDVAYDKLISHKAEGEWSKLAPLRILSFDIECAGRKGVFPEPNVDPVIQIGNHLQVVGETTPRVRSVFVLNTCSNIVGAQVLSFKTEAEMLEAWQRFVVQADPDLFTGWNIQNFDFPYLINRAAHLKVMKFPYLSRRRNAVASIKDTTFSSKAYGTRENKSIATEGRVMLDMLQVVQRDHKLRSYTLNAVSAHFLGEQKEDVQHSIITDLHMGNAETRHRLAVYCLKDAYLPMRLMEKLMVLYNYVEMARVTGVPLTYLLTRGQQIKVVSQLHRKAMQAGLLIPHMKPQGTDEKYEGATVIEPMRGYYDVPIATLDFSSLYPSIMMAHNLCYSTLVHPQQVAKLTPDQYIRTPTNDVFVRAHVRKGLLPQILEELLDARKKAKADLKKETDPFKRAVLDGRQLALKISANSVYGFTGATVGRLPCLEISSSVTGFGRQMIEATKQAVEERFNIANGYENDAVVVYGDTDSVMVKFGPKTVAECMKLGKEAAEFVSGKFVKPIKLEFEKVYFPYLLMNKKRYAGLYWTKPDIHDKMDAKGIEIVRRDTCQLVGSTVSNCLRKILIDRDVAGSIQYAKDVIADLLQNRVDMSQLVITKSLSKDSEEYANKQAHVELAERMRQRDAGSAPGLGDRVAYVIIKGARGAKAYEKAEDPVYVLENNIPLDTQYYLEQQLSKPLMRIFEAVMDRPEALLTGDHTRVVHHATPAVGGIMGFAVKKQRCLGCKAALNDDENTVCKYCKDREPELFQKHTLEAAALEREFARAWSQCQSCQGSLHQDVLCTSRDCPIFYKRKKVQKELREAVAIIHRFDYDW